MQQTAQLSNKTRLFMCRMIRCLLWPHNGWLDNLQFFSFFFVVAAFKYVYENFRNWGIKTNVVRKQSIYLILFYLFLNFVWRFVSSKWSLVSRIFILVIFLHSRIFVQRNTKCGKISIFRIPISKGFYWKSKLLKLTLKKTSRTSKV